MQQVQDFISITPWTLIFQICNLLILTALIKKFLFKPVMAVLDKRQAEIDGMYSEADKAEARAKALKSEYEQRLATAREEADGLVQNAMRTAQVRSDEIVGEARERAVMLKNKADQEIEQERKKAFMDVKNELSGIAVDIASKVVEREVDAKDHEAFIEDFIRNVGEAS
ncbi:F0F1 ATP synthase subunit B [Beduinella massiliensis]|uniref:F0F1 ATP synthase subunit B n=1 Tax=Beduinella massiliensis TaxID=1852363 RepID=UPI000C837D1A